MQVLDQAIAAFEVSQSVVAITEANLKGKDNATARTPLTASTACMLTGPACFCAVHESGSDLNGHSFGIH